MKTKHREFDAKTSQDLLITLMMNWKLDLNGKLCYRKC